MTQSVDGLFNSMAQTTVAPSEVTSVKQFLNTLNNFGVQVQNNFEIRLFYLNTLTFYAQSIDLTETYQNFVDLYYDGRKVEIPINYDQAHDFSMTILNDAQGYIYTALTEFITHKSKTYLADSGYTMTVKGLTGDTKYSGSIITCYGVRLERVSNLSFGHDSNNVQTFTISGKMTRFEHFPNGLTQSSAVLDSMASINYQ